GRRVRHGARRRRRGTPARAHATCPGGRVLPRARTGRSRRGPRHAQPVVPARDALGRAAARSVAPGADRLPLRPRPASARVPRRPPGGVRRRRHRLAKRDPRRLPALVGLAWSRGRHRGGGLRLALLPRHGALAHAADPPAGLRRARGRRARRGPAARRVPAVPEPPLPQDRGPDDRRVSVPAVSVLMSVYNGAPWVARRAADDLALPERLARQRAFLDAHPDVGLLGTGARAVDAAGREVAWIRPPEDDGALRRVLIRRNPFVHSSVMMRRAVVE